jgi:hypothetical protein
MAEIEQMLARREQIAAEITKAVDLLGALVRQEAELRDTLRRAGERDGSRTNPFETASTVMDALNSELVRVGISPRRADPRHRLVALVTDQDRRFRSHWETRAKVSNPTAA